VRLPFTVDATEGSARAGRLVTPHGVVATPQFLPVATQGTVRAQRTEDLAPAGATMLLANTWHLAQRPGLDVLEALGGLRALMRWPGAILTDSGGFQVFSLDAAVDEAGVDLRQPASGKHLRLTPESAIAAQRAIGSDIAMVLDQCVPSTSTTAVARDAMERTTRWAARCLTARGDAAMGLFAIVQGACDPALRRESADSLTTMPFDGFAIGGLAVGEGNAEREDTCALVTERLPADRPRYLMGVGTPLDLLEGVARGVDLFDCILPTSLAQRGRVYTRVGRLDLRRGVYRLQDRPLDPACPCDTCQRYSRAYLHHLYAAREPLAWTLLGLHNLQFWLDTMAGIRLALANGTFAAHYAEQRLLLDRPDDDAPPQPGAPKRRRRPPEQLGGWELHHAPAFGDQPPFVSIRDRASGEVMHAVTTPEVEARRLYVEQPGLDRADRPMVVWDVGLGAGTNAMEIVHGWERAGSPDRVPNSVEAASAHPLHLVSFERDLDALRLAVANSHHFPRLRHGGPAALLDGGVYRRGAVTWTLLEGDALVRYADAPAPDVVIYDPFSFKVDAPMWTGPAFAALRARCVRTRLYTYSNSTAVRLALLAAGFYVGPGVGTGPKGETTVASTHADIELLGPQFLDKWRRSSVRWPGWVDDRESFAATIEGHPQFA
jgi:queuine tRNA-ribosyltransferase